MDIVAELRADRSELDSRAACEIELLRKIVVLGYDDQDLLKIGKPSASEWQEDPDA